MSNKDFTLNSVVHESRYYTIVRVSITKWVLVQNGCTWIVSELKPYKDGFKFRAILNYEKTYTIDSKGSIVDMVCHIDELV